MRRLLVLLLLAGCTDAPGPDRRQPAGAGAFRPPALTEVGGVPAARIAPTGWSDAVVDGLALHVRAYGARAPSWCGPATALRLRELEDRVELLADQYEPAGERPDDVACTLMADSPRVHSVRLAAPLGDRELVDAATGTPHDPLDAAAFPQVRSLPAGYGHVGVGWEEGTRRATRTYRTRTKERPPGELTVETGPSSAFTRLAHLVARVDVGGRPAEQRRSLQVECVRWEVVGTTYNVCSRGVLEPALSSPELLAAARSTR